MCARKSGCRLAIRLPNVTANAHRTVSGSSGAPGATAGRKEACSARLRASPTWYRGCFSPCPPNSEGDPHVTCRRTARQPRAAPAAPLASEAGFSVIEGLIAALLLLIVTLGILPLFSRAMNNNVKGNDSTRQSNAAIDAFESAVALPFNSGATDGRPATTTRS